MQRWISVLRVSDPLMQKLLPAPINNQEDFLLPCTEYFKQLTCLIWRAMYEIR